MTSVSTASIPAVSAKYLDWRSATYVKSQVKQKSNYTAAYFHNDVGLAVKKLRVWFLALALLRINLGQFFTPSCLTPWKP